MDEADRAFLASIVPAGSGMAGFLAIVTWIDENGRMRWRTYNQLDVPITNVLGLLELAKLDILARTPGTGLPFRYEDTPPARDEDGSDG